MLDASESLRLSKLYEQLRLKLLDLSLKNRMLNYSLGARSKRHLQVVDEVLDEVYKKLVEEEASLRILPLDEPADIPSEEKSEDFIAALQQAKVSNIEYLTKLEVLESQGRDDDIALGKLDRELRDTVRAELGLPPRLKKNEINRAEHARSLGIAPNYELPPKASKKSHSDQALQTLKFPDELESVMDKIADTARLAEQEMGLSTLFLAFGFLEWYESDSSDRKAFAPLLLLPVRLEVAKSRGRKIYYLSAREGSAETNLSLRKRLGQFPCELPDFDSGEDEKAASIDKYLQQVKTVIEGRQRWNVRRWLVLGHFAFGRSAMYADLNPENWKVDPVQHGLVSSILRGTEDAEVGGGTLPSIPEDYHIDDPEIEKVAPFLIQDADASQHSALVDVMRGKNLVIQGPPGTGKSQTITNIIANAMEAGKRVLFLSEKQAALEVVKRRLAGSGLGDFCLELHSDKSSPKRIIEDLKQRAEAGSGKVKPAIQPSDIAWHESRKEMGTYLSALHAEQPDGATPFDLIWSAVRGRSQNANVVDLFKSVALPDRFLDDPAARAAVESKFSIFVETSRSFSDAHGHPPAESPWRELDLDDLGGHRISPFLDTLEDVRSAAVELTAFMDSTSDLGISSAADVGKMICADRAIEEPAAPEVVPAIVALDLGELERALGLMIEWHNQSRLLAEWPDLSHASLAKLSIASALMRCGLPAELARMTPAELYDAADNAIPRDRAVLGLVQRLLPILAVFGFDENLPSGALMPLALAVLGGAKVRPEHRRWVNALRQVDPTQFWKLKEHWTAISTNESKWRGYCAAYGRAPWPSPEEFEIHAAALRKSGMKKAWAALHGSLRVAREFAEQFGFAASADVSELLDRLGKHARLVRSFEGNEAVARVLGNDWHGLATAFEEIDAGFKLRQLFQEKIGGLPHGEDVAERLVDLAPDIFDRLNDTSHVEAAVAFSKCPTDVREQFDTRPLARLVETCRNELAAMEKASGVDQSRSLSGIELPITHIAEIAEITAKRDALNREVNASPVSEPAKRLGESATKAAQAVSTIKWVRAINSADMPRKLRDKLLAGNAREERLRLRAAAERGGPIHSRYVNLLSLLGADFGIDGFDEMHPNELATKAGTLISVRRELSDYLSIRRYRSALVEADLGQFISRAEDLRLSPVQLPNLLKAVIAARRALRIFAATGLAKNSGAMLDAHRRQFADRDRKKIENDRVYIRKVLLQKKPEPGSSSGPRKSWTEMALLQNEFLKQKRFTPVRSLLMRAGRSIQAFKPCFMMSPLSLAKFVPAGRLNFDVLVIDEASQMKPEDALGSLLRVGQIVVVGDQKQLPPTDFFNRSGETTDDEDFEDVDDESILESCQKAFRDVRRLKWHYRSRCESLIRFSNENFYRDSPLITFPAAKPDSFSIDLIRVDGVYQFRRNVAEASLVAQKAVEIMRRYAHADAENIPTLGIATVNIGQRDLLQEELNRVSAGDALVEEYHEKVAKKGEPVFVKNLENVQGDERDVILISMTYGREAGASAMKQRFGPINGKQGHRRLNVLFTRARIRIGLFTSFGSADIKPTDVSAEGVHVLKRYLEYAEGMGRSSIDSKGGEADSDFEIEVAERLRTKGYDVERQVGVSGFKIDIGVRDPDHPERFLAGVECDGARYHSSKSARDRDRLREEVLRGLGWDIVRVWSTDWFEDPTRETDKLAKKLQELRERPRAGYDEHSALAEILLSGHRVPSAERPIAAEEPIADTESAAPEIRGAEFGSIEGTEPPEATPATEQPTSSLLNNRSPLTREQGVQTLVEFRDTVIRAEMPDWEVQRSILRDAMVETFVSQNVFDPDDWFRKVPTYLRQGTSPIEKNRYLDRICEIVSRISAGDSGRHPNPPEEFKLTLPERTALPTQSKLPLGVGSNLGAPTKLIPGATQYVVTDLSSNGLQPDAARFYDSSYQTTLREMIARVVATEAPIYEDLLVDRIARAHGFQRSGSNIYQIISKMIGREHARSNDDDRSVIWSNDTSPNKPYPYRDSTGDVRSHLDVPIAELASLALPYVRLHMSDEEVIRRLADHFQLGRLREGARTRFEKALTVAQQHQP
jgi:very-short-patch-repair endonuclease